MDSYNNYVEVGGRIKYRPSYSHEVMGERFFTTSVMTKRLSENEDVVPVIISERLINLERLTEGTKVYIEGQFRSFNKWGNNKRSLMLSVFAREMYLDMDADYINGITLEGYICKQPTYRVTPLGRQICDVLLAVNRPYHKSDYIPCVTWGRNAKYAAELPVGTKVRFKGRVQSRTYVKNIDEILSEERVAYEASISSLKVIE